MPKTTEIRCDGCGRNLTNGGDEGAVRLLANRPETTHDAYFCEVGCLVVWLAREYPADMK